MKVTLPDGHWAEFRDLDMLGGGDRRAYKRAIKIRVVDGQPGPIGGDITDTQQIALLRRIIRAWSFDAYPLPLSEPEDTEEPVLDRLPLKYLDALIDAAEPYFEAVDRAGKSSKTNGGSSTDSSPQDDPPTSPPTS